MERTEMLAELIVELARRVSSAEDAAMSNKAMCDMAQAEIRRLEDEIKAAKGEIQRLEAELSQAEAWSAAREAAIRSGRRREVDA